MQFNIRKYNKFSPRKKKKEVNLLQRLPSMAYPVKATSIYKHIQLFSKLDYSFTALHSSCLLNKNLSTMQKTIFIKTNLNNYRIYSKECLCSKERPKLNERPGRSFE